MPPPRRLHFLLLFSLLLRFSPLSLSVTVEGTGGEYVVAAGFFAALFSSIFAA